MNFRAWFFSLFLPLVCGCATASSRFSPDIHAALAHSPMRRLETEHLVLYYPEARAEQARRSAAHFENCYQSLFARVRVRNGTANEKARLVLPEMPFNNAYVNPPGGYEIIGVIPTFNTNDFMPEWGIAPDPSSIGCHELVHYVQALQTRDFPKFVNDVLGAVYTPQEGLDSWFWEGLAVYYETKLQNGHGRLGSPFWNGVFAAGTAGKSLNGGDLSIFKRAPSFGAQYLVGSHFIEYLASHYGESKLWEVVYWQSDSVFYPLGISPRFKTVYKKTLSTLIDEFSADLQSRNPIKNRPTGQREIKRLPRDVRYACSNEGWDAFASDGVDDPLELTVYDPTGERAYRRNLTDILPPRRMVSPYRISGMSFSGDRRWLYFVALDYGDVYQTSRLMRVDLRGNRIEEVTADVKGPGGSISPDGRVYYFSRANGDRYTLAAIDVDAKHSWVVADLGPRTFLLNPRVSPDGGSIVATLVEPGGSRLAIFDAKTGLKKSDVAMSASSVTPATSAGGLPLEASWVDNERLVYLGEERGRYQVFVADLAAKTSTRATDAPYLAYAPCVRENQIRFLNRDGWAWTLDEVSLPSRVIASRLASTLVGETDTENEADESSTADPAFPKPVPLAAAPPASAPKEPTTKILADESYSRLDHLFVPQLRTPSFSSAPGRGTSVGLNLRGADRLGFHSWSVGGEYNIDHNLWSGGAGYLLAEFAPLMVSLDGQWLNTREQIGGDSTPIATQEGFAALTLERTFFGTFTVGGGPTAQHLDRTASGIRNTYTRGGLNVEAAYGAGEATPYAGFRRALETGLAVVGVPSSLNSEHESLADISAYLGFTTPLPLSRRHTLRMRGFERELLSTGTVSPFQVGGHTSVATSALRGFEDRAFLTERLGGGVVTYRFPLILDWGNSSTLWLFPSLFLRQIDIEAFASAATFYDSREPPVAVGGALTFEFALWRLPLPIQIQLARHLTYDERWSPFFSIVASE